MCLARRERSTLCGGLCFCTNDYSERSFQLERGGQWVKGKSADTFAPLGPFLATPDEIADGIDRLAMWLKDQWRNSSK